MNSPSRDIGLALSGGGYRANLYHLGALQRFNDVGLLPRLHTLSSVSGGSITSAALGLAWPDLRLEDARATNIDELVTRPIVEFSTRSVDVAAVRTGLFIPGVVSRRVVAFYRRRLFGAATLDDLPDAHTGPRSVIAATNLRNGALWNFSRERVGDDRGGYVAGREVEIAEAVAASSAFPPVLSPHVFDVRKHSPRRGDQRSVRLTDGGVFDKLGVEPFDDRGVMPYLLVSDGGAPFVVRTLPRTWLRGMVHVTKVIDFRVRKLRRSHIVSDFASDKRRGALWTIDAPLARYAADRRHGQPISLDDFLPISAATTHALPAVSTQLAKPPVELREQLIRWGYGSADAGLRKYTDLVPPGTMPVAAGGVRPGGAGHE